MCRILLLIAFFCGLVRAAEAAYDTRDVPLADGFDLPVGKNGKSYYKARGVRPNGHLGEDWNGVGGGDTDMGDPIYAAADGIVTFAQDYRLGWGNVVIIRSGYMEDGDVRYVDSLYGHLLDFSVKEGQIIKRGQLIARMGNNRGMYAAHLHFEMRKNINVGMYRSSFARDWSVYWSPTEFIAGHRSCSGGGRMADVPINTYPNSPPPVIASTKVYTPEQSVSRAGVSIANGQMVTSGSSALRRVYASAAPSYSSRSSSTVRSSTRTVTPTTTYTKSPKIATGPGTATTPTRSSVPPQAPKRKIPDRHPIFRVNRFEDMKVLGYE
jgi:hypothetical protein